MGLRLAGAALGTDVRIGILGPLEVLIGGTAVEVRAAKHRILLSALAVSANRAVSLDHLEEALWGDEPPPGARSTLQGYVHRVRKVLELAGGSVAAGAVLETHAFGYALRLAPDDLDAARFERMAREGHRLVADDPARASRLLADALALWRGPALSEVAHLAFAQAEAVRLEEARLVAAEDRVRAELALGHHEEIVGELATLVGAHPRREHLTASYMLALYRSGRQAEALRAFQQLRRHLGEAMGIEPSPQLVALEEAILLHEPDLRWVAPDEGPDPGAGPAGESTRPGVVPPEAGKRRSGPLVGREVERRTLLDGLEAARGGQPSVAIVRGEAGIGKTRLVGELVEAAHEAGAVVLAGACSSLVDSQVPFAPLAQALRGHLARLEAPARNQLAERSQGALWRVVPELAPPGAGEEAAIGAARLRGLLLRTVDWIARSDPVVLVLEDLHWADTATAELVEFLARNLSDQRVLVVVTTRTDELHPRHPRWALLAELERSPLARQLDLGPLGPEEVDELVTVILGRDASHGMAWSVVARAGGNPLFVEELVAGIEQGTSLPSTLQEMLVARSAPLGAACVACLRVLAVAGRPLDHPVLAAASGLGDGELLEGLRAGVDHDLVIADGRGYRLAHALVGEAHAADLLPGERTRIHGRVAAALAGAGAAPAELAHHWLESGNPAEALPALVRAAEAAERARGRVEAVALYERAIALWERVPDAGARTGTDLAGLHERAAEVALLADRTTHGGSSLRFRRAVELTEAALAHVDVTGEPARAGVLHARLGAYLWHLGRDGSAHWDLASRLLPEKATAERTEALAAYAEGLAGALRYQEAIPLAEEAAEAARGLGLTALEGRARTTLGSVIGYLGDVDEAEDQLRRAVALAEEAGAGDAVVVAYNLLSGVLSANDRLEEGLALDPLILEVGRRYGLAEAVRPGHLVRTAMHLYRLGRWDDCQALLAELDDDDAGVWVRLIGRTAIAAARGDEVGVQDGARRARRQDLSKEEATLLAEAEAQLALWLGRPADARATVDAALDRLGSLDAADFTASLFLHGIRAEADLADRARAQGCHEEAAAAIARAQPLVDHLQRVAAEAAVTPWILAVAATGEAEAARLRGETDISRWDAAVAAWESLGRPYPLAWTQWRAAEAILASCGPRTDAVARLRASLSVTEQLRLQPLQARIRELAERHGLEVEPTSLVPGNPA